MYMAVYFEGNAYIDECLVKNTLIQNSEITSSTLDMDAKTITNVKDPTLDQEAATKKYVDDNTSFKTTDVNLYGTSGSLVFAFEKGSYLVKVQNLVENGPSATFNVSKSDPSLCGQVNRYTATTGTGSKTTLFIDWGPSSDIYLRKTSDLYDGDYRVIIL